MRSESPPPLLHLDQPTTLPSYWEFETRGWVASDAPIERVFVEKPGEVLTFAFQPRPDVRAACPQHAHTTGFSGSLTHHFVEQDAVTFSVQAGGVVSRHRIALTPPTFRPATPGPDHAITPELKQAKIARVADRLICPRCHNAIAANAAACPKCHAAFQLSATLLDFFTPEQRATIPPVADITPSRGAIDEVMYAIIQKHANGVILDCGAGCKERIFPNVLNLEIMDYPSTDVRAFNESLPFADATFDALFTCAVLEHVRDPFAAGREIMRVLKPGGILYSMVPLIVPFHGYPNHFYNMTTEGHRNLYGSSLDVLDVSSPMSGRPIWGLAGILNVWANGLPEAHREEFLNLTVRELMGDPLAVLTRNHVRYLSREANLEIATVTRIIGRKR